MTRPLNTAAGNARPLAGRCANRKVFQMRTFVIEGKPLEEVTIKVKGQSLTLTEGVEVTVIVVVAAQQSVQADLATGFRTAIIPCPHCGVNVTVDSDMLPSR